MVFWFQIIAEAATHVAVSRHGAGKGVETSMFTHAWFRRVFRLPSVVAVVSVYSHDDVVAVPQAEAQLRRTFGAVLAKTGSGFAFGSPCSVGDILFLEEVTARGGEIWLVLPVNQDVLEAHLRERFTKLAHAAMLTPSAGEGRSRTQSWRNASSAGHGAGMRAWAGDLDEPLQPTAGGLAGRGAGVADPRGQSPHSFGNARTRAHSRSSLTTDLDSPTFVSDTVELWIGRLRALLACATKVDVSNSMSPEFSSANMHYCGMVLYGLAVMKAEKLGVPLERVLLKVCWLPTRLLWPVGLLTRVVGADMVQQVEPNGLVGGAATRTDRSYSHDSRASPNSRTSTREESKQAAARQDLARRPLAVDTSPPKSGGDVFALSESKQGALHWLASAACLTAHRVRCNASSSGSSRIADPYPANGQPPPSPHSWKPAGVHSRRSGGNPQVPPHTRRCVGVRHTTSSVRQGTTVLRNARRRSGDARSATTRRRGACWSHLSEACRVASHKPKLVRDSDNRGAVGRPRTPVPGVVCPSDTCEGRLRKGEQLSQRAVSILVPGVAA